MRLLLASASPRRAELLTAAAIRFDLFPVDVDERPREGEAPVAYVTRLACDKADEAFRRATLRWPDEASALLVLGADTAVVLDGQILGKPRDRGDAEQMLRGLSGRSHEVVTGVSLRSVRQQRTAVETTTVVFDELAPGDLSWYLGSGEGEDKAGAYAIQGLASRFIPCMKGSYSNVVGLPVATVFRLLRQFDYV